MSEDEEFSGRFEDVRDLQIEKREENENNQKTIEGRVEINDRTENK